MDTHICICSWTLERWSFISPFLCFYLFLSPCWFICVGVLPHERMKNPYPCQSTYGPSFFFLCSSPLLISIPAFSFIFFVIQLHHIAFVNQTI